MSDFFPNPYRGDPSTPHAPEEFFKVYFLGAQLALTMLLLPGRFLGSEIRPRRYNRDFLMAVCDENARRRQVRRGKKPTTFMFRPDEKADNFEKKWWKQLHWKRWTLERMGGGYINSV